MPLKNIMRLAVIVFAVAPLFAASYTVKAGGGGSYTTIQACANATAAGDTCTVYAGTYNEAPNITTPGTGSTGVCSSCITFIVHDGDTVTTQPWTIGASYIIVQGFTITDPTFTLGNAGIYINSGTTGVQILNNILTQVGRAASGQTSSGYSCISMQDGPSHYTTISGNMISWCSSLASQQGQSGGNAHMSPAIIQLGDHTLIQNNDISHANYGIQIGGSSTYVVMRGNIYHDTSLATDAPGCLEVNNCDTHLTFHLATNHGNTNILEENETAQTLWGVNGGHFFFLSSSANDDQYLITRFNQGYQVGSDFVGNNNGTSNPYAANWWKVYNNTYIVSNNEPDNSSTGGGWAGCNPPTGGGTNNSFLNNLFYNDVIPPGTAHAGYYHWQGTCTSFVSGYNLGFDSACTAGTLAGCTSGQMATDPGNIYADPQLVATNGTRFDLRSGSPALNAGRYLTTVASGDSGSGTSLIVNDATYFQDGLGINGVTADCVSVTTTGNHVCITALNYSTNTLTLASGITRSSGDSVWLYSDSTGRRVLIGSAPNIGSYIGPNGATFF
jgi:hypothetical protein